MVTSTMTRDRLMAVACFGAALALPAITMNATLAQAA